MESHAIASRLECDGQSEEAIFRARCGSKIALWDADCAQKSNELVYKANSRQRRFTPFTKFWPRAFGYTLELFADLALFAPMSTIASIAEYKSDKVARRRNALGRYGHSFALLAFAAGFRVLSFVGLKRNT